MTERLSQLLHDEATAVVPPPPDTAAVLGAGRRIRQRRRVTGAVVASVAAVALVSVGVGVLGGSPQAREVVPAAPASAPAPVAFGVGSDVHVGDVVAQVPDTVHSLHYTSVGVLVRSNPNGGASDGSGPESLTLVRWDGSTEDLGTIPEGVGPATDPTRDVYVLAEAEGDGFAAVVREAETGDVVQRTTLPDGRPSYWDVPPLALDGDDLYIGFRNETKVLGLGSGDVATAPDMAGGLPEVVSGRTVVQDGGLISVRDAATGEVLLDVDTEEYGWGSLSPDGRYLRVVIDDMEPQPLQVYDVATGKVREFPMSYDWGWTADGDLFKASGATLTRCDAATGDCTEEPLTPPLDKTDELRLGGQTYES